MSFAGSQSSSVVDHVPALVSGSIADATPVTITFANVTDQVTISNTTSSGTTSLQVAMSVASLAGASSISLGTGESITIKARMKAITVKMLSGTSITYAVVATLNRIEAGQFPALTTANGFEKV